jgi:hypothetical protein
VIIVTKKEGEMISSAEILTLGIQTQKDSQKFSATE